MSAPILAIDAVSASYTHSSAAPARSKLALDRVSLHVSAGDVTALLGANGAGKSSLLRVAAGLVRPTEGTVRIGGAPLSALDRRAVARVVAFVPQSEIVPAGFRVREIVAMGRAPHQGSWMRETPDDRAVVDDAIARCDLGAFAERWFAALSSGEQRRVCIARALAQRPRLLLLDEPAAFLDLRHRFDLHALLAETAARDGLACVVATHDLDAAARFSTNVVLLREGRVVAGGPPADVLTPEHLRVALDASVDVGVHASGWRYFVPLDGAR